MATPPLNGSLEAWPDLAARFSNAALLCGNGLSINVWPAFAYGSLFDQAHDGWLTDEDLALFGETENFERVLSDLNTAIRVSNQLRAGTVWVNQYNMLHHQVPFGGYKESGIGRELGEAALANYTQTKSVSIRLGDALFG